MLCCLLLLLLLLLILVTIHVLTTKTALFGEVYLSLRGYGPGGPEGRGRGGVDMAKWKSGRVDRMRVKGGKDPYRLTEKPPGGTICQGCGAIVVDGRWTWSAPSKGTVSTTCPACRRIQDDYPAGYIELQGQFFAENRKEIMNLVKNVAEAEKSEHPLERVIAIRKDGGATLVTTTGVHIARRLGDSIKRSYQGELTVKYEEGEKRVRVNWAR
jgi:hypothetical protein